MPNVNITIRNIEDKGTYMLITDQNGVKWSGFKIGLDKKPTGLADLHVGDEIEADGILKGKYHNIGAFHVIARNTKAPETSPQPQQTASEPKPGGDLRNRSFALSYAKDLAVAGKIDISQILPQAATFDQWLQGR